VKYQITALLFQYNLFLKFFKNGNVFKKRLDAGYPTVHQRLHAGSSALSLHATLVRASTSSLLLTKVHKMIQASMCVMWPSLHGKGYELSHALDLCIYELLIVKLESTLLGAQFVPIVQRNSDVVGNIKNKLPLRNSLSLAHQLCVTGLCEYYANDVSQCYS
jgi:hypothetical protein